MGKEGHDHAHLKLKIVYSTCLRITSYIGCPFLGEGQRVQVRYGHACFLEKEEIYRWSFNNTHIIVYKFTILFRYVCDRVDFWTGCAHLYTNVRFLTAIKYSLSQLFILHFPPHHCLYFALQILSFPIYIILVLRWIITFDMLCQPLSTKPFVSHSQTWCSSFPD